MTSCGLNRVAAGIARVTDTERAIEEPRADRSSRYHIDGPRREIRSSAMHGYTANKENYLKRLRRIEGQIRGLQRMVESDEYCIDVLTQSAAASKALQSVSLGLIEEHLRHCVAEAMTEGGEVAEEKIKEANDAIARLVRS